MKTRLSMLVAALCTLAYFSSTARVGASGPVDSSRPSAIPHATTSDIFDPFGLLSPSQHGELTTLGTGFGFTEGPAVDRHGNVFFTDQPNDRIYRWDAGTGQITLFLQGTGRANGMAFDKDGNLIACADMHGELWKIHPDGSHEVLVNNYGGRLLNGPNDVWINPANGGMYISDPIFPRSYWDDTDPRKQPWEPTHSEQAPTGKGGYVYYLPRGGSALVRVTTEALGWNADGWPNGVVGTPDGKTLYVNKWFYDNKGGTWAFDINPDGTLSNMRQFSEWGGDGMSMDELGNVYISNGQGVMAFDPQGNNILRIPTGGGATNNTFAGRNDKILFITGPVNSVTAVKMSVKGAPNW